MTDKEFVLSVHPTAVCDGELSIKLFARKPRYAIFLNNPDKTGPRQTISWCWTDTEDSAWEEVAKLIRIDMLRKFES